MTGHDDLGEVTIGTYWQRSTLNRARSAYVVDLDHLDDPPTGLTRWIERAIVRHTARGADRRAALAQALAPEDKSAGRVNKQLRLEGGTVAAAEAALVDDRRECGRIASLSGYISEAVRIAANEAEERYGRPLPPAPGRLPNSPSR